MKTLTRTRYIPSGYTEYTPTIGDYPKDLFAVYVDLATNTAIFYKGKSTKHLWYNRFSTTDAMKNKINNSISSLMSWEETKAKRAEARKAPTGFKVGDILYSSWGYEQTNIDFYKVVGRKGARTVELRKIGSTLVSGSGGPTTFVTADPERFVSDKILTHRASTDSVRLNSYAWAYLWDGKPKYETGAGWGH